MTGISIVTWNLTADFMPHPHVPAWAERRDQIGALLRARRPTVIGFQEMMPAQYSALRVLLPGYEVAVVHAHTDDPAVLKPLHTHYGLDALPDPFELALFYRTDELELLAEGHWWLSPTPERVSVGFGNRAPRAVMWVRARLRETAQELLIFNTHLDHRCVMAMVDVCLDQLTPFAAATLPMLFIGDFNAQSTSAEVDLLRLNGWQHTRSMLGLPAPAAIPHLHQDIDHVFYQGALTPQQWEQIAMPDERLLSDHAPIYASFNL